MIIKLDKAIKELSRRGTDIVKSDMGSNLKATERNLSLKFGNDFREVYSKIDGFTSYDNKSQLMIWSIKTINDNNKSYPVVTDGNGTKWVPIGDFLIDSDILVAAVENENATTKLLYDDRIFSNSIASFICEIAAGKYDF